MSETYEKVTDEILKVINNDTTIHIFQTKLDHLKLDKSKMELEYKNKIEAEESKLAVLDS